MDTEKEREAFDAWFKSLNENGRTTYFLGQESTVAWEAWQAAKAESHKSASLYQLEINHLASANQQLRDYAAKAKAVPEGFVLVSAEQMSQWGHMANCAQEYGCPECFEARGYAHSLACEINAYFNVSDAQEQK